MSFLIDPVTRQRVQFARHTGDINYDLFYDGTNDAIAREDVPLIGNWVDWTGSADVSSSSQDHFASSENRLQGQDAQVIDNAKLPNLTVIGTNLGTHRRRIIKRNAEIGEVSQRPESFSWNSTS